MSAIVGIVNLDGRPAEPDLVRRMLDALVHRGPDAADTCGLGAVGLGHRLLRTTPESALEHQPLRSESGDLCLVLDGRIDNGEELKGLIESRGLRLRDRTDSELVLRAYQIWGEECPSRLLGDFAFGIWDEGRRRLFCARDPLGIRPFYYFSDARRFIFASEIRAIFQVPGIPRDPNEGMVGEHLADAVTSVRDTLFQHVHRLPPAHALELDSGGLRQKQYWNLDPSYEVRHHRDEEYAEHFRDLFKEAVRCRMRSPGRVAVTVSGGLDSTSIAAMAISLAGRDALAAYSLSFTEPAADEREFVTDAATTLGIPIHAIDTEGWTAPPMEERARATLDFPEYPNLTAWEPLLRRARAGGSSVVLWGVGGDHWLNGSDTYAADLLRAFRLPSWIRFLRDEEAARRSSGEGSSVLGSVARSVVHALPRPLSSRLRRYLRGGVPRWINPRFARRIGLRDRLRRPEGLRFPKLAQETTYTHLFNGWGIVERELLDRYHGELSLEARHPFFDVRLIRFAFGIPEEQRRRRGEKKFILRQAMKGLLPERIRSRRSKGDFSHLFAQTLLGLGGQQPFKSIDTVGADWLNVPVIYGMHRELSELFRARSASYPINMYPLWMIFGIEAWRRSVADSSNS
jgi:asparagine synthase (glutamine-hydrolysing)